METPQVAPFSLSPFYPLSSELFLEQNRSFAYDVTLGADYANRAQDCIELVDSFQQLQAMEPTDYRLPFETEHPDFAWADEQAAAVVIKHNEKRIFMTLNWRHQYCVECDRSWDNARAHNISRVHYTTDTLDRIATIVMESFDVDKVGHSDGIFGFYLCRYGDHPVGMNLSEVNSYMMPLPSELAQVTTDLISGRNVDTSSSVIEVGPLSTVVIYLGEPEFCGDAGTYYLPADMNKDYRVDYEAFAISANDWLAD